MLRRSETGWNLPPLEGRLAGHIESGAWPAQTILQAALARVGEEPDRLIVEDDTSGLSRAELLDRATRLGSALHASGLRPGSVVAFQLPNWIEACVVATACAIYGFVQAPLLIMYRERELGLILSETGCEVLFIPGAFGKTDFKALAERTLSTIPQDVRVVTVRDPSGGEETYERLLAKSTEKVPYPDLDPASAKFTVFTSGTTGRPKGVVHSHYTAHATVMRAADFWDLANTDRLFVPSPIGHVGGSLYAFELPWFTGASAHLMAKWDAAEAVERIDQQALTFMAGATPFLKGIVEQAKIKETRLPSLRRFICGGASIPETLMKDAAALFENAVVSRAYGSTEIPLLCPGVRTRADLRHGITTDGRIDSDLLIVDEAGRPVPEGAEGDIIARSPSALIGYFNTDDEDGQFSDDGYFKTGDIGRIVDGAFVKITGRRKEIIIRLGENISASEVENALMDCESVRRAAVVGVPNERTGERVVAFVDLEQDRTFSFEDMQTFLEGYGLAKQKFPEELHVMDRLPTNAIGKVLKLDLKQSLLKTRTD